MQKFLLGSLLLVGTLASCAPHAAVGTSASINAAAVTQTPILIKASDSAARGQDVTIQGRYLGGPAGAHIRLGADADGKGGYLIPDSAIKSWTDTQIVFTVPSDAPVGGSWLYVEVGNKQSTGLMFSVSQAK